MSLFLIAGLNKSHQDLSRFTPTDNSIHIYILNCTRYSANPIRSEVFGWLLCAFQVISSIWSLSRHLRSSGLADGQYLERDLFQQQWRQLRLFGRCVMGGAVWEGHWGGSCMGGDRPDEDTVGGAPRSHMAVHIVWYSYNWQTSDNQRCPTAMRPTVRFQRLALSLVSHEDFVLGHPRKALVGDHPLKMRNI